MSTTDPQKRSTAISARYVSADDPAPPKRTNWFMWISALLAVTVVALIVWNLSLQSDLDDANAKTTDLQGQVTTLEGQVGAAKDAGTAAADEYRTAYEDLQSDLGTTQSDLADTEQELEAAQAAAEQADKDAAAAKQQVDDAQTAAGKSQAEAEQAQADAKAATANATVIKDCGNAFLDQVDVVIKSDDPAAAAATAKEQLKGIAGDCKAALGRD